MRYRVNWSYQSSAGGPWSKGQVVEIPVDQAEAVNASSPGVLTPVGLTTIEVEKSVVVKPEPAVEPDGVPDAEGALAPATGERQVTAARNRAKTRAGANR